MASDRQRDGWLCAGGAVCDLPSAVLYRPLGLEFTDMKTIIEMAREAGAAVGSPVLGAPEVIFPQCLDVQRFAELVRADEREENAKVCDDWPNGRDDVYEIGKAIRARGNT
jgi:hypothetical protein